MKCLLKRHKEDTGILCEEIVVDGRYYYMSNILSTNSWMFYGNRYDIKELYQYQVGIDNLDFLKEQGIKSVIATTNPDIDLPNVISYDIMFANEVDQTVGVYDIGRWYGRIQGYNHCIQETPNSDIDMLNFHRWLNKNDWCDYSDIKPDLFVNTFGVQKSGLELVVEYRKDKPKVLYIIDKNETKNK